MPIITARIVAMLIFTCTVLLIAACGSHQTPAVSPAPVGNNAGFTLSGPSVIRAGDEVTVTIHAPGLVDDTQVMLVAVDSFGPHPFTGPVLAGQATFTLPADITDHSNLVTLIAGSGHYRAEHRLQIKAGAPVGTIPVRIGPKSIVADGQSETILVAFPVDKWQNPVQAGTPVTIQVQPPAPPAGNRPAKPQVIETTTKNLLIWSTLKSGTVAGQKRVAVSTGQAHSTARTLLEVPGQPVTFTLSADRTQTPADGYQLVHLTTSQIADQYGNVMLDGTSLNFLATAADGSRRIIPAHTIAGQARAVLQAPTQPGTMTVQAVLAGGSSQPVTLTFTEGPAVEAIPITTSLGAEALEIVAGPLVGPLGQLVPDGTPVTFQLTAADRRPHQRTESTYYGYATTSLRRAILEAGVYEVTVTAGTGEGRTTIEVN